MDGDDNCSLSVWKHPEQFVFTDEASYGGHSDRLQVFVLSAFLCVCVRAHQFVGRCVCVCCKNRLEIALEN